MEQKKGLDKSQFLSFAVFGLLMIGIMYYFQPSKEDQAAEAQKAKVTQQAVASQQVVQKTLASSATAVKLENKELSLSFSSLGAQLSEATIKPYQAYDKEKAPKALQVIKNNSNQYGFTFKDKTGKLINTKNLLFTSQVQGNQVTFTSQLGAASIQMIYILQDKYKIDFKIQTKGLQQITNDAQATLVWDYNVNKQEKGRTQEQSHTEFVYSFDDNKTFDTDARSELDESKEKLNWIGVKQQFFATVLEAQTPLLNSKGQQDVIDEGEQLKKFNYNANVAITNGELNQQFAWYVLPLETALLDEIGKNFSEILPWGWSFIGWLNRYFFMSMYNMLASTGISAGWAIFWLTIIIKLILSPIMYKQHKLSAMMKVIKPEIDEAHAKLKNPDAMQKQQATMEIYRKAGVNQLAGCLPALLQIPIFMALYRFFPNMMDLRGKSFWFAEDLTAYDDVIQFGTSIPILGDHLSIFAIACTVVLLINTVMTSSNMQQPTQEGMPNMKVLMYIFPITFLFFLNSSASGLSWYYFVSNALNILIILVIKYFIIDEKKIHAMIAENKTKPVKESKFQNRMKGMMDQAKEQQRLQEQERNKRKK